MKNPEKTQALLADSDGTLVNTVELIRHGQYKAATEYLTNHGIPPEDLPDYPTYEALLNQTVGGRTRDTMEQTVRLLYQHQPHYLETINFDELYARLAPIQDKIAQQDVHPYPGLAKMLTKLGSHGIKFAIISSGNHHMIVRNIGVSLPELGMAELFKADLPDQEKMDIFTQTVQDAYHLPAFTVVTSDDTAVHKPDPAGFLLAMKRLEVSPKQSAVLGDHAYDMEAGERFGAPTKIGATHGFDDEATLIKAGATHIVHSLEEVVPILTGDAS